MSCPYEDIVIYARGLYGRQGENALNIARERAVELSHQGDEDGADAWRQVSTVIEGLVASERRQPLYA